MPSRRKNDPRTPAQLAQVYGNVGKSLWQGSALLPSIGIKLFCLALETNLNLFLASANAFQRETKKE